MTTRVVHCKYDKYDIYIGRPSKFGNKFSHLPDTLAEFKVATRSEAINKYKKWLLNQPELIEEIKKELKDKVLGCFCRPFEGFRGRLLCHGQILASIIDGTKPEDVE